MPCVILDHRPPLIPSKEKDFSLLMLPLGASTLLDRTAGRLVATGDTELLILPTFDADEAYERRIQEHTVFRVRVLRPGGIREWIARSGSSEFVLLVDPAWWTEGELEATSFLRSCEAYDGVCHLVAAITGGETTRERVECDADGTVQRVERIFDRTARAVSDGEAVLLTRCPMRVLENASFQTLGGLRLLLTSRGILSYDHPHFCDPVDLRDEAGLLMAQELAVEEAVAGNGGLGFRVLEPGVLAGDGVVMDSTAKVFPPLVLYPGCKVEAGATLVGPMVVGADCRVERGAVVAQSLLAPGSTIRARSVVRGRFVCGSTTGMSAPLNESSPSKTHFDVCEGGVFRGRSTATRRRQLQLAIKRGVDLAASFLGLVLLSPLILILAVLIKLDSSGPVFFGHRRERHGGREFRCLKFRTMVTNAQALQAALAAKNEVDGPQFKIQNDPRVTRMGRFLRGTNLDEIPQLWNVLLGQMSLVGPRPSPFRENQICVPWRQARLSVRPGITGLWQVCRGNREESDFNQWILYDILYVRHFSLLLDAKILAMTILTLGGKWSVPISWMIPSAGGRPASNPEMAAG